MPLVIQCGGCGKKYRVSEDKAGAKVRCRECETVFVADPVSEPSAAAPPPSRARRKRTSARRRTAQRPRDSSKALWIVGTVAATAIVGLVFVIFLLLQGSDNAASQPVAANTPAPAAAAQDVTALSSPDREQHVDSGQDSAAVDESDTAAETSQQPESSQTTPREPANPDRSPVADQTTPQPDRPLTNAVAATVSVTNQTPVTVSEEYGWSGIPDYLHGAVVYAGTRKPGRTVDFTVDKGGIVVMAASWDYDGNKSGGWYETRTTKQSLKRDGWVDLGSMSLALGGKDHQYTLFGRTVESGETFQYHTRKYNPPFVIALDEEQARVVLAKTEPPEARPDVTTTAETKVARTDSSVPGQSLTRPAGTGAPPETPPQEPKPIASGREPEPAEQSATDGLSIVDMAPSRLEGDSIPNYLHGATIYRRQISGKDPAEGLLTFKVESPQAVFLQASWTGSPLEEVRDEITSRKDLLRKGWMSAGRCPWSENDELFYMFVTKPASFRIRTNSFQPPWLIAAEPLNVRDAAEEPEVPQNVSGPLTFAAARDHLEALDYDWLEETADLFRTQLARHHTGHLKLVAFYEGLSTVPGARTEDNYKLRDAQLTKWLEARPESVTARIALGGFLIHYAWLARGSGYLDKVAPEGKRLFIERFVRASELLSPLTDRRVQDPLLYRHAIWCAIALNLESKLVDTWLKESLRIDPRYTGILHAASTHYLPRWGGDDDDVVELADRAVELTRDELGLGAYAVVVEAVRGYHPQVFDDFDFSRKKSKQGFQDLITAFPHDRSWYDRACLTAAAAGDHETVSEMLAVIGDHPVEWIWPAGNYFRRFVLSYSAEAVTGEQQLLMRGNVDPITQLDISPDGSLIASTDMKDRIFIHDVESGTVVVERTIRLPFNRIACSPIPGYVVLGGGDGQVNLANLLSEQFEVIGSHQRRIADLEVATDKSILVSASEDGVIRIWEGRTGDLRHTINLPVKKFLLAMTLSRDASLVAAVCDTGQVHLCDTRSGDITASWEAGIYPGLVALSADGRRVAIRSRVKPGVKSEVIVSVWDTDTQTEVAKSAPQNSVASSAFHPEKDVVSVTVSEKSFGLEGGVWLWNFTLDADAFVPLVGHKSGVYDSQFFADGRLATCGTDGTVRIWDTR